MTLKCNECPHFDVDDGGFCCPETQLCTYGGRNMSIKWYTPCPMDLDAAREEADRLYPDQTCEECASFQARVDMGWSHSDIVDLCWTTQQRNPTRGGEGCIFQPKAKREFHHGKDG